MQTSTALVEFAGVILGDGFRLQDVNASEHQKRDERDRYKRTGP